MEFKLSISKTPTDHFLLINDYTEKSLNHFSDYGSAIKRYRDLKNRFSELPKELLILMCSEQVLQGNEYDPIVFLYGLSTDSRQGGFNWSKSVLGYNFWEKVIDRRNFDHAIKLYNQGLDLYILDKVAPRW